MGFSCDTVSEKLVNCNSEGYILVTGEITADNLVADRGIVVEDRSNSLIKEATVRFNNTEVRKWIKPISPPLS